MCNISEASKLVTAFVDVDSRDSCKRYFCYISVL